MTESIEDFAVRASLPTAKTSDQVRSLIWFLHYTGIERVVTADITNLYRKLHLEVPNVSYYLGYLSKGRTRSLLKDSKGYRLEAKTRSALGKTYTVIDARITIKIVLSDLTSKLNTNSEKEYLEETLRCYSVGAFKASIVMAWNLAYSHIVTWIIDTNQIGNFNSAVSVRYPKNIHQVSDFDSFHVFKEFEVVEICFTAKLIDKNRTEIMRDKLRKRNTAAHPSTIVITQVNADDFITDLVNNVVTHLR